MDGNAKLQPGIDTLRDPHTGALYDVVGVILPDHLHRFTDHASYRGGGTSERCAFYGPVNGRDHRPIGIRAHRGPQGER